MTHTQIRETLEIFNIQTNGIKIDPSLPYPQVLVSQENAIILRHFKLTIGQNKDIGDNLTYVYVRTDKLQKYM